MRSGNREMRACQLSHSAVTRRTPPRVGDQLGVHEDMIAERSGSSSSRLERHITIPRAERRVMCVRAVGDLNDPAPWRVAVGVPRWRQGPLRAGFGRDVGDVATGRRRLPTCLVVIPPVQGTVPQGASSATVNVTGVSDSQGATVTLTATLNGKTVQDQFTVQ